MELRQVDILLHPPTLPTADPRRPSDIDITLVSPYTATASAKATQAANSAAVLADKHKLRDLERKLTHCLTPPSEGPVRGPGFDFRRIAFDSLAAPARATTQLLDEFISHKVHRYNSSDDVNRRRIYQRLSSITWPSIATSILSRNPLHMVDVAHPVCSQPNSRSSRCTA